MTDVLVTARLCLRELVPDDLDFVAGMLADPRVSQFYPKRFDREDARDWIDRQIARYAQEGHGLWLVSERATGRPVGQVGLLLQKVEGVAEPEMAWLLPRQCWGKGYATEAAAATRQAAFSRWSYPHVVALIRPDNAQSRRVADRLGMTLEREVWREGFRHLVYRSLAPAPERRARRGVVRQAGPMWLQDPAGREDTGA